MDGPASQAERANRAVSAALSLDEKGRPADALAAYRFAAKELDLAMATAAPGTPVASKLAARRTRVAQRIVKLASRPSTSSPTPAASRPRQLPSPSIRPAASQEPAGVDRHLFDAIESEIMETAPNVSWDDVSGCDEVKRHLQELLVWPAKRPDLFTGIRSAAKGLLLAGPPGTGKTLCAKAAATECSNAVEGCCVTFFSVSASTFASKWHGESEKLVRALFHVARERQPSLIFIDEVDSLLGARGSSEHEASRRLKTEFLVQVDGCGAAANESVFVMGATNRPQDLDDAVLRRLSKRIYVPLPSLAGRLALLRKFTVESKSSDVKWSVSIAELTELAKQMEFFSGADIHALVREASLMPLRELPSSVLSSVDAKSVRGVSRQDFEMALRQVKPSVSRAQLAELEKWSREFGVDGGYNGKPSAGAGSSGNGTSNVGHSRIRARGSTPWSWGVNAYQQGSRNLTVARVDDPGKCFGMGPLFPPGQSGRR